MSILSINELQQFTLPVVAGEENSIDALLQQNNAVIVVVDDDPTGAQYAGVPLLTNWSVEVIKAEIQYGTRLFFILTNSRSLPVEEATEINRQVGHNLKEVFRNTNRTLVLISRSDSTLRGHYPHEVNALAEGFRLKQYHTAIIPAYFEAGRYTFNNVQYVQQGEQLVPAHLTPFALDKVFGYTAENLQQWVSEKTRGAVAANAVQSFGMHELTQQDQLIQKLQNLPPSTTFIVNAVAPVHLQLFIKAYLRSGVSVIFRTGPSFVAAIGTLASGDLLSASQVIAQPSGYGGLIIVGSYVPATTVQLEKLLHTGIHSVIVDAQAVLQHPEEQITRCLERVQELLGRNEDVVLYTSRQLVHGTIAAENLAIGHQISSVLVQVVKGLTIQPRYIVAKGGITANDIAVKALGIEKAIVLGQVLKGLPVWKTGHETKFPGLPYIVFPGNVGDEHALVQVHQKLLQVPGKLYYTPQGVKK